MATVKKTSSEDRQYKILFDSNPNPMWIYELDSLKFLAVNDAAVFKYGYSGKEFLKMTLLDIRPKEDVDSLLNNVNTHSELYQWTGGWRHVKKDKTIMDVEILSHDILFAGKKARLVAVNDVTDRKRAENALKDAEYRYRSSLDNMMEGFQIISPDWKYLYVNDAAAVQGKSTKDKLLNHTMMEIYPGIENTSMFSALKVCMQAGVPQRMENEFIFPDGSKMWFDLNLEPVPEGVLILSSDITTEKLAKIEVQHLNRVYAVLSNINQAIVRIKNKQELFDTACKIGIEDGKFKMCWIGIRNESTGLISVAASSGFVNGYFDEVSLHHNKSTAGLNPTIEMFIKKEYVLYNNIGGLDETVQWRAAALKRGYKSVIVFPLIVSAEIIGNFSLYSGEIDFFEEKEFALLKEMVQDISFALETMETEKHRMRAEKDLKESERRFFNAFEYAAIGMAIVSLEGNFIRVNNALCNITGYPVGEMLDKNFKDITHPDDIESDQQQVKRMLSKEINTYETEKRYIHKSGREIWIALNSSLLRDDSARPLYFISQMQDITVKKKAELELISAKEQAEEMNRLKSNFLANMSHELRTPMIGILGTAELLKESESIEEIKDFIPNFEESAQRLLRTLNHILDISKIEAEKIKLQKKNFLIDEVILRSVGLFKMEALRKNLWFNLDVPGTGIMVNLDEDLLIQILNNLISNALKYTSEGGITIHIEKKIIDGSEFAEIIVSDTGIGIPEDKYDLIFLAFRQASEGLARQHEGTGLGLTLVKKYTELMGGRVSVESAFGKGSHFILQFPLAERSSTTDKKISAGSGEQAANDILKVPGGNVLYVDDDKVAQKFIVNFLSGVFSVQSCLTGEEAIDMISKNKYDIILIDINLGSGISGVELMTNIKQMDTYRKVPLIAITGYAMIGDKEKFLSKGFDYYIPKPVSKTQLLKIMKTVVRENYNNIYS